MDKLFSWAKLSNLILFFYFFVLKTSLIVFWIQIKVQILTQKNKHILKHMSMYHMIQF